ncbi:hypothetical protein [Rhodobacter sp. SY28-1]
MQAASCWPSPRPPVQEGRSRLSLPSPGAAASGAANSA